MSSEAERERADRISFLAGLERVATARPANQTLVGGGPGPGPAAGQIPGYFDQNGNPVYTTKMSTVGSASATGSAGGRTTTWASSSQRGVGDEDVMSVDVDVDGRDGDVDERSAIDEDVDGMSDNASLVGFGEGAGSTVSGPIYTRKDAAITRGLASQMQQGGVGAGPPAGVAEAERILRERLASDDGDVKRPLGSPDEAGLGKFYFEEKK